MRCEGMQRQLAWRMMEEQWRVAMPFYTAVALSFDKLPTPAERMMMATGIKLASSNRRHTTVDADLSRLPLSALQTLTRT